MANDRSELVEQFKDLLEGMSADEINEIHAYIKELLDKEAQQ